MSVIYTRASKGAALTWQEGDDNITNLNNDKIESVSEDTSPQLGGDLDVAAFSIVSTNNNNIQITPDGSGKISLDGVRWPKVSTGGSGGEVQGTVTAIDDQRTPNTITLSNFGGISVGNAVIFTGTQVSSAGLVENQPYEIAADLGGGTYEIADPIDNNPALIQLTDVAPYTDLNYTVTTSGGGGGELVGGEVLTYNTDGDLTWTQPAGGGGGSLNDLSDVNAPSPGNNSVLAFNTGTNQWEAQSLPASGASALTELNDTNITAPANNNVLRYDGTNWVNTAQTNLAAGSATNIQQNTTTTNTTYYPLLSNASTNGSRTPLFDTRVAFIRTAGASQLDLGTSSDIEGQIRLWSNDGGSTNIRGGTSTGTLTFRLPSTAGSSGQVLSTNGSGTLSWVTRATSSGVTSVSGTGTVNGLTLSGTVTTTGSLTLGGTLSLVSPPAIGSTTANTGRFTTLTLTDSLVSESNSNITLEPNGTGRTVANRLNYNEAIHSIGTTSGTVAPDAANGNVQTITLDGNLTLNAFTNPVAGQSITLIVNTGGTGRTLTSSMKFAGGEKTLSTTNTTDIVSVFYDGTNYWASLSNDFK
jgi:hypothetical protein